MMKQLIGALLAAAALAPVAVSAQQRDGTDDGPRPQREMRDEVQREARQQARQQDREARQQERAGRPTPVEQQVDRPQFQAEVQAQPRGDGGWQGRRGDRQMGEQFRGQADPSQAGQQDRSDRRRDWQRQQEGGQPAVPRADVYRDRAPDRGSRFDDRSRIDTRSQLDTRSRFGDRDRVDGRGRYEDRNGNDRNRFDDRANYDRRNDGRAYEGRGYQNGSTFDGRYGDGRYGDRGYTNDNRWNRDWRGDNRYDWNRYRSGNRNAFHLPRYYSPYGWDGGYRRFSIGVTLSSVLWGQNYWINDPYSYRLPEAYGSFRWVRYYNDALLIDLRFGYVVDTVYGIFY